MFIARSAPVYVVAYLVLMVPTYILPYFGSNSTLLNAFSTALGVGPMPQWWAHVWCLIMIILLSWLRGKTIGKTYLPVFPMLAAVFDLTPGLSAIPMIPTLLHLAGIIVGAIGAAAVTMDESNRNTELVLLRKAKFVTGIATLFAIGGSALFMVTMPQASKSLQGLSKPSEAKAPATKTPLEQQPKNSQSEALLNKNAVPVPISTPLKDEIVSPNQVQQETTQVRTEAGSHSTKIHRNIKVVEKKSATNEKPDVRYINLND